MNIEINGNYTFATLFDLRCKCDLCACWISTAEIKRMQLGNQETSYYTDVWTMKMTSPGISFFGVPQMNKVLLIT